PFMILTPYDSLRGRRLPGVVRSVDVLPTILDLLGMPAADKIEGRSLVPMMTGASRDVGLTAYAEAVYPRYHYGWSDLRSVTSGHMKYIAAPRPELYDLAQDPNETRNLYDGRRAEGEKLAALITGIHAPDKQEVPPAKLDADARARLSA